MRAYEIQSNLGDAYLNLLSGPDVRTLDLEQQLTLAGDNDLHDYIVQQPALFGDTGVSALRLKAGRCRIQ